MSYPVIDWPNLTDDELEALIRQAEAEQHRRREARRPRSFVDDIRAELAREAQAKQAPRP
jgi:hypothetical protein